MLETMVFLQSFRPHAVHFHTQRILIPNGVTAIAHLIGVEEKSSHTFRTRKHPHHKSTLTTPRPTFGSESYERGRPQATRQCLNHSRARTVRSHTSTGPHRPR